MNQDRCHKLGSPGNRLWDLDAGSLLERVLGNNIHQKGGMQEWAEASADLIGSSGVRLTLQISLKQQGGQAPILLHQAVSGCWLPQEGRVTLEQSKFFC